ncbi:MAG: hypothetical protein OD918_04945 [Gammaproteobacteria bacterium]
MSNPYTISNDFPMFFTNFLGDKQMAIRNDGSIETTLTVENSAARADVRQFLLATWAKEAVAQKYRYFAEVFDDGKRLYLERPGRLNKGCDFVIYIEDSFLYKNKNDKPPSHAVLFSDLRSKKRKLDAKSWGHLIACIESVHQITPYDCPLDSKRKIDSLAPMTLQQIQLLCKWFFIEQDLTYWSGQGRNMLMEGITEMA